MQELVIFDYDKYRSRVKFDYDKDEGPWEDLLCEELWQYDYEEPKHNSAKFPDRDTKGLVPKMPNSEHS